MSGRASKRLALRLLGAAGVAATACQPLPARQRAAASAPGDLAPPSVVRFESTPGQDGAATLWAVAPAVHLRVDVVTFRPPFHCLPLVPNHFTRGQVDVHCTPDLARPVSTLFVDGDGLTVSDLGRSRRFPRVSATSTFELPGPPEPPSCPAALPTIVEVAFDRANSDLGWTAPSLNWRTRVAKLGGTLKCSGTGLVETCSASDHTEEMRVTPDHGLLRFDAAFSGMGDERRVTGYVSLPCGADVRVSTLTFEDP